MSEKWDILKDQSGDWEQDLGKLSGHQSEELVDVAAAVAGGAERLVELQPQLLTG